MKQWEYRRVRVAADDILEQEATELSREGWELISVFAMPQSEEADVWVVIGFFRREITSGPPP
jgi:hypothetical protein